MKKLILLGILIATTTAARADFLYFMVDGYTSKGPVANFDYAMVGVADGEGTRVGYLDIQTTPDQIAETTQYLLADNSGVYSSAGPAWANITDNYKTDSYWFYIETYASDDSLIWGYNAETAMSYSQLLGAGHIYQPGVTDPQNITPWNVPEPTGGLLTLLGGALLALRRRRCRYGEEVCL